MSHYIDTLLSGTQKEHLISLVEKGLKVRAIKELRDLIDVGLVEARDYIYDIYDEIEKEKVKIIEKEDKKIKITTYDELKDYLVKNEMVKKEDDSLWDIIDLAFDAGVEEGETTGYKMRLDEEEEEK